MNTEKLAKLREKGFLLDPKFDRLAKAEDKKKLDNNESEGNSPEMEDFSLSNFSFYYSYEGEFLGISSNNGYSQVRIATLKRNNLKKIDEFHPVGIDGKPSKNWIVIHNNHETFKQILGTLYTETDAKLYTENEAAGIYSVMRNRSKYEYRINGKRKKLEIGPQLFEVTKIYGWKLNGKIKDTTQAIIDGKLGYLDKKFRIVFKGMVKAIVTGNDYSNGATVWQGNDFKQHYKGTEAYEKYYLVGFQFTNKQHDVFKMGDYINKNYTIKNKYKNNEVIHFNYKYLSTYGTGGSVFMVRSWWSFADNNKQGKANYPAIQDFYLKNRDSLSYEKLKAQTLELVEKLTGTEIF